MLVLVSEDFRKKKSTATTQLYLQNLPRIVICLIGKGWIRFREPVSCSPTMASAVVAVLSVPEVRLHNSSWSFLYLGDELV
jgi:hypothetical protein